MHYLLTFLGKRDVGNAGRHFPVESPPPNIISVQKPEGMSITPTEGIIDADNDDLVVLKASWDGMYIYCIYG